MANRSVPATGSPTPEHARDELDASTVSGREPSNTAPTEPVKSGAGPYPLSGRYSAVGLAKTDAGVTPDDCWTREQILAFRAGQPAGGGKYRHAGAPPSSPRAPHVGTYSRYTHGCRCSSCREAARIHKRAYEARARLARAS